MSDCGCCCHMTKDFIALLRAMEDACAWGFVHVHVEAKGSKSNLIVDNIMHIMLPFID
jgi:hypothetical protein